VRGSKSIGSDLGQRERTASILRDAKGRAIRRGAGMMCPLTLALVTALVVPALACAATHSTKKRMHKPVAKQAAMAVGIGNPPGCVSGGDPTRWLVAYHATVLHEIIDPRQDPTRMVPCLAAAAAHHYRVTVAIQYWNGWTIAQDVAYFQRMVRLVAPYAWAISIGNEQDIHTGGPPSVPKYVATWRAVEPIVARLAPRALRVAGEISPWGERFLKSAWSAGLRGAQVMAAHPYRVGRSFRIADLVRWSASIRKPLWLTEGMAAPRAWGAAVPRSQFTGAAQGVAWLG
jgi:hypothetical protein